MNKTKLSPMMQQYFEIKNKYQDCLVFFRLGDFYEMFYKDAETGSKILNITLTARDSGNNERAPMCGVPYHSAATYISKLLAFGKKIAICEQIGKPVKNSKNPLHREVVRIISPGTVTQLELLKDHENNFISCIYAKDKIAISWLDISTGEFFKKELKDKKELNNILSRIHPKEILCNEEFWPNSQDLDVVKSEIVPVFSPLPEKFFEENEIKDINFFKNIDIKEKASFFAASALLNYVEFNTKSEMPYIADIQNENNSSFLNIDYSARINLELTQNSIDGSLHGTLYKLMNKTQTCMGARMLRNLIEKPLLDKKTINNKLDAVSILINDIQFQMKIKNCLKLINDIDRLSNRISNNTITPEECLAFNQSLAKIPLLYNIIKEKNNTFFDNIKKTFLIIDNSILSIIGSAIYEKNSNEEKDLNNYKEKIIKDGYNEKLDYLRKIKEEKKNILNQIEKEEKENTGIKNLKINYTKILGYFIEIPKSLSSTVPDYYYRKQTVANTDRYTIEKIIKLEGDLNDSEKNIADLEAKIYKDLIQNLACYIKEFKNISYSIAHLDCILAFAEIANLYNYTRPQIVDEDIIYIKEGRHPIVENSLEYGEKFVPNDTNINTNDSRVLLITGPNMAGKSVFMRQTALICIMAQMGSFVPCESAKLGIVDKIFTRIGASDDLSHGKSTFMVEMSEVSYILENATSKSLILLDEVGRGTSTLDGMSIAWAIIEFICNNIKSKTLFSTHYHELTKLEEKFDIIKNYKMTVYENGDNIVFLRKFQRGYINKSFGIEVAKIAGLPQPLIDRAKNILHALESTDLLKNFNTQNESNKIEDAKLKDIINIIKKIKINNTTPIMALDILNDIIQKVK